MRLRVLAAITAVVLPLLVVTTGRISTGDAEQAANSAGRIATEFVLGVATAAGAWIADTVFTPLAESVTNTVLPSPAATATPAPAPRPTGGTPTGGTQRR